MFALIDCNNFYVSCERSFQPQLEGGLICVLSNNDGCVISRSDEAKAIGIPMGAVAFQYKEMFEKHNVKLFSANFILYGDMSRRVMNITQRYCPEIEVYSIDEAFLDFSTYKKTNLKEHCINLRKHIKQGLGLPTSVGIAPTKTLSKVANKIARKFPEETEHVFVLDSPEKIEKALKWFKIEDVWGIGRKWSAYLQQDHNIRTAWDFTLLNPKIVKKAMGVVGLRLQEELKGNSQLILEEIQSKKSISVTRTFNRSLTEQSELSERIATFAVACSEKLRAQKSCATLIYVFLRTNTKSETANQYANGFTMKLATPTNSAIELAKAAQDALNRIYLPNYNYKKAGVVAYALVPNSERQLDLFIPDLQIKHLPIMKVMDRLNQKYKGDLLQLASQNLKSKWMMKQDYLSKQFTTDIEDIIRVKV